jgi:creatinine amidohydrolase/Fe(II)-dependent formamide hydrolase-like protein
VGEPSRCLLQHGFKRAFILNGHGGNTDVFHLVLRQLATEFPGAFLGGASYWNLAEEEIAEAQAVQSIADRGHIQTALDPRIKFPVLPAGYWGGIALASMPGISILVFRKE